MVYNGIRGHMYIRKNFACAIASSISRTYISILVPLPTCVNNAYMSTAMGLNGRMEGAHCRMALFSVNEWPHTRHVVIQII